MRRWSVKKAKSKRLRQHLRQDGIPGSAAAKESEEGTKGLQRTRLQVRSTRPSSASGWSVGVVERSRPMKMACLWEGFRAVDEGRCRRAGLAVLARAP